MTAQIKDNASFSIAELKFSKVEPTTEADCSIINNYLLSKCK